MLVSLTHGVVTAGTEEMRRCGATFLQLKLVVNRGGRSEDVFMGAPRSFPSVRTPCSHAHERLQKCHCSTFTNSCMKWSALALASSRSASALSRAQIVREPIRRVQENQTGNGRSIHCSSFLILSSWTISMSDMPSGVLTSFFAPAATSAATAAAWPSKTAGMMGAMPY